MESITQIVTQKLKLKANEAKGEAASSQEPKFLGFSSSAGPEFKRVIATKAVDRFKRRIRDITRRANGRQREDDDGGTGSVYAGQRLYRYLSRSIAWRPTNVSITTRNSERFCDDRT